MCVSPAGLVEVQVACGTISERKKLEGPSANRPLLEKAPPTKGVSHDLKVESGQSRQSPGSDLQLTAHQQRRRKEAMLPETKSLLPPVEPQGTRFESQIPPVQTLIEPIDDGTDETDEEND